MTDTEHARWLAWALAIVACAAARDGARVTEYVTLILSVASGLYGFVYGPQEPGEDSGDAHK